MYTLVKTSRANYWHIRNSDINETICEKKITKTWNSKIVQNLPKNICTECSVGLPIADEPALPEVTNKHSSWK